MLLSNRVTQILGTLSLACGILAAQTQLAVTISPPAIEVNQTSQLLISLTNINPAGNAQVLKGDVLRIYLALGDGAVQSVSPNLVVSGSVFQTSDWTVDSSSTNPVTLVYQGVNQLWPALEGVAVSLTIQPPSSISIGEIVLRMPTDGRYGEQEWQVSTVNLVSADLLAPSASALSSLTNVTAVVGPAGPVGPTGPAGPQGPSGSPGPQGAQGAVGPQGSQGPAGPPGTVGPAGSAGLTGATGPIGPLGPAGPQGIPGSIGPAGLKGSQGEAGPAGPPGAVGPVGPQGPAGVMGLAGPVNIYWTKNSEQIALTGDAATPAALVTLSLPQGGYWVLSHVMILNGSTTAENAQCDLGGSGMAGATIAAHWAATIPLQTTVSGGTLSLECSIDGTATVLAGSAWMTAVEGTNIVKQ
jgi:hypothetical protein